MLDPEIPEERREQIASEARKRIESGGTLKHDTAWGMRKLAYEIRQRTEADYRFFRFETEGGLLDELNHNLRIADGVLRFRIFKVDPRSPAIVPPAAMAPPRRPRLAAAAARAPRRAGRAESRASAARPAGPPRRRRKSGAEEASEPRRRRGGRAAEAESATRTPPAGGTATEPERRAEESRARSRHAKAARCAFRTAGGRERAAPVLRLGKRSNELRKGADANGSHESESSSSITGNLTRDPELRSLPSGTSVCKLRVAVNSRRKDQPAASGSTSRTTSTSPSGARRARTAPPTSPRAVRWPSRAASSGANGRPRTGRQAPGGRDHRRLGPVPRLPRRRRAPATGSLRRSPTSPPTPRTSRTPSRPASAPRTTTSRSRPRQTQPPPPGCEPGHGLAIMPLARAAHLGGGAPAK